MGKNNFRKAIKILNSKEIDEKLKVVNEFKVPANSTAGVYNKATVEVEPPEQYWDGGEGLNNLKNSDFSQDYLAYDPTGQDTSGLIGEDGTVFSKLPPGSEGFILGPIVDEFVSTKNGSYTSVGYLQKDTRQFVLLAKIAGQWEKNMNGSHPVWDGTQNGLTIYNQNFTLEMAQWVKERISLGDYVRDVPYFYSGGQSKNLDLPNNPGNMKSGNGIGPNEYYKEDNKPVFTNKEKIEIQTTINDAIKSENSIDDIGLKLGKMAFEKGMSIKQMDQLLKTFDSKIKNYEPRSMGEKHKSFRRDEVLKFVESRGKKK